LSKDVIVGSEMFVENVRCRLVMLVCTISSKATFFVISSENSAQILSRIFNRVKLPTYDTRQ
jgi:hypothetical protein